MIVRCPDSRWALGRFVLGRAVRSCIRMAVWNLMVVAPARASDQGPPVLLGIVTRSEIEAAMPGLVSEEIAAEPDLLALLTGQASGWITASEDLLTGEVYSEP